MKIPNFHTRILLVITRKLLVQISNNYDYTELWYSKWQIKINNYQLFKRPTLMDYI